MAIVAGYGAGVGGRHCSLCFQAHFVDQFEVGQVVEMHCAFHGCPLVSEIDLCSVYYPDSRQYLKALLE